MYLLASRKRLHAKIHYYRNKSKEKTEKISEQEPSQNVAMVNIYAKGFFRYSAISPSKAVKLKVSFAILPSKAVSLFYTANESLKGRTYRYLVDAGK